MMQQLGVLGKTFHCDMCSDVIQSDIHLFQHGRIYVRGLNQFVCSPCVTEQLKTTPIQHKVLKTSEMRRTQHVCGLCDKTFPNPNKLRAHERVHTCEKPFKCHVCDKSFTQKSNLTVHLRIHTGERQFVCPSCNAAFRQKVQLVNHETIHSGLRPYACSQCGQTFRLKKDLRFHARKHVSNGAFVCGTCGKGFHRPGLLKYHEMRHSLRLGLTPTDKKTHKCEFCSKVFIYTHELKVHLKVHYGGDNRPYKCNQCDLTFRNANHLYLHKKMHPVDKPYECSECKLMFKREIQLTQHRKCHTGERPLGCDLCGKAYKSALYLKRHKVAKHRASILKETPLQGSEAPKRQAKGSRRAQRKQIAPRKQKKTPSSIDTLKEQLSSEQVTHAQVLFSMQELSADLQALPGPQPKPSEKFSQEEQSHPFETSQDAPMHSAQDTGEVIIEEQEAAIVHHESVQSTCTQPEPDQEKGTEQDSLSRSEDGSGEHQGMSEGRTFRDQTRSSELKQDLSQSEDSSGAHQGTSVEEEHPESKLDHPELRQDLSQSEDSSGEHQGMSVEEEHLESKLYHQN